MDKAAPGNFTLQKLNGQNKIKKCSVFSKWPHGNRKINVTYENGHSRDMMLKKCVKVRCFSQFGLDVSET